MTSLQIGDLPLYLLKVSFKPLCTGRMDHIKVRLRRQSLNVIYGNLVPMLPVFRWEMIELKLLRVALFMDGIWESRHSSPSRKTWKALNISMSMKIWVGQRKVPWQIINLGHVFKNELSKIHIISLHNIVKSLKEDVVGGFPLRNPKNRWSSQGCSKGPLDMSIRQCRISLIF